MAETGEKYTEARRGVIAGRDPGRPPVILRVYLNRHVDLELTPEAAQAYTAASEQGRHEMTGQLLMEEIEMAGAGEAAVAASSAIVTSERLHAETRAAADTAIRAAVQRSLERAVGLSSVEADLAADLVRVTIRATRPGVAWGLPRPTETEEAWREMPSEELRRELTELTGRPVRLEILQVPGPDEAGRQDR
jgi:hypothetical protein